MRFPVFKAFGATLAYLAGHAGGLLQALWLPALLFLGATMAVTPDYLDGAVAMMALGPTPDPEQVLAIAPPMIRAGGVLMLANVLFYPMMTVGALRHVVRGDRLKWPFYLGFGGDEIRTLGAYVLMMVMLVLVYLVFILAIVVILGVLSLVSPMLGGVAGLAALVAGFLGMVWFMTRLSVTLPAALAERSLGVAQSWRATKGNSARLFFYWILIAAPLLVVIAIYAVIFLGDFFPIYQELIKAGADQAAQQKANVRILEIQREFYDITKPKFWSFAIGAYLYMIATMAIINVASGIAWRYLTDRPAPAGEARGALAA